VNGRSCVSKCEGQIHSLVFVVVNTMIPLDSLCCYVTLCKRAFVPLERMVVVFVDSSRLLKSHNGLFTQEHG